MSELHRKTYDQVQKDAPLVTCARCARSFYMTVPRDICVICQDEDWVKSIAVPGEKVTR